VKFITDNRALSIALAISILAHGLFLLVRFTAPDAFRLKSDDQGLEVVLVNAKHQKAPVKADALAQANLDGGGNADAGRAKSPLPDMQRVEDGDSVDVVRRRVAQLEALQQQMLAQLQHKTVMTSAKGDKLPVAVAPVADSAHETEEVAAVMARMEAEIARNIETYNKRPKKTQITPSTREVGYALYYKKIQEKIERVGTLNFPQSNGQKLYGSLLMSIPVFQDGTIYDKEGGIRVERSSGNPELDRAAVAIVKRSAPFDRLPANMRSTGKDDVWEIITRFNFTRDEGVRAQMQGNSQ
jgi:protein TonB